MFFLYASLIIATACSVITQRTLVGYNHVHWLLKLAVFGVFFASWCAPLILGILRRKMWLETELINFLTPLGYICFGFVFILFVMLFLRDGFWFVFYRIWGHSENWNPVNIAALTKANIVTVILAVVVSAYAYYEGTKLPQIKKIELTSDKIKYPVTLLQINDVHLHGSKPVAAVRKLVNLANSLQPDIIVMPGDIIDDSVGNLAQHLQELAKLQAKYGVYVSAGNHEYYNGLVPCQWQFQQMGFNLLSENGQQIEETGLYLAGIPDNPSNRQKKDYPQILQNSLPNMYKILLAHNPSLAKDYLKLGFDLQLSAHTHGGQIFPFHILVKVANKYLSGKYNIDGKVLYISNGAGYWGPPMRLFAPSDITLITLKPKK